MSYFRLIAQGVDVSAVNAQISAMPDLWGKQEFRTKHPSSPHNGVPDIWLRWRASEELTSDGAYSEPHFSVFWPAWGLLPALRPILFNLARVVEATAIGGILLTRIPPGAEVKPHTDSGWHPSFYDTKLYLCLRGNPLCLNYCGGDVESFREGDVWEFPNSVEHSVVNGGKTERMTCIMCFRTENERG